MANSKGTQETRVWWEEEGGEDQGMANHGRHERDERISIRGGTVRGLRILESGVSGFHRASYDNDMESKSNIRIGTLRPCGADSYAFLAGWLVGWPGRSGVSSRDGSAMGEAVSQVASFEVS